MPEPRFELKIGARVEATDGPCGHVQQVMVNPREHRVVALVVRRGRLFDQPVVVPLEQVADATDDEVRLKISREQVAALPTFNPDGYVELPGGRQGFIVDKMQAATPGETDSAPETMQPVLALHAGQQVFSRDEHVGQVGLLLFDLQGQVRHFVLHRGHLLGRDVIVPVNWVQEVDQDNVHLTVEQQALEGLPEYHPDDVIKAEVKRALWDDDVLREGDDELDVAVREGVVILNGYVMTAGSKARAERAARRAPGVLGIEDHLIPDDDLVSAVAQKLAGDACSRGQTVFVHARNGVVYLGGEVSDAAERAAIEACAAGVPQARGIINGIRAPDVIIDDADQRVLQPRIGQEVYATDMVLGHVEHVIVSPRNRRVTAMIVNGQFPDPKYSDSFTLPGRMSRRAREVVIPIGVVRHVTGGGVELRISGIAAADFDDVDPARFATPDEAWQPPYPYSRADVLLDPTLTLPRSQSPEEREGKRLGMRVSKPTKVEDSRT